MATRYINPTGSNTAPYETPAKGATSLTELIITDGVTLAPPDITYVVGDNGNISESQNGALAISGQLLKDPASTNKPKLLFNDEFCTLQMNNNVTTIKDISFDMPIVITGTRIFIRINADDCTIDSCAFDFTGTHGGNSLYAVETLGSTYDRPIVQNCLGKNLPGRFVNISGSYGPLDIKVINNTIYNCSFNGNGFAITIENYNGCECQNNIISDSGGGSGGARRVFNCTGTVTVDYNLTFNTTGTDFSGEPQGSNEIVSNPLFTAPGTDFSLQIGSPAIDGGTATSATFDFDGTPRPIGAFFDMGAFEAASVDVTPPVFQGGTPALSSQVADGADVDVEIDEDGEAFLVVVPNGDPMPSSAQVVAGEDSTGTPVAAGLAKNVTLTASTPDSMNLTGLSPGEYDVWVVAQDDEGTPNLQATPTKLDLDLAKPNYATGYPTMDNVQATTADVLVQVDENGTAYVVVVANNSTPPTKTQIKAGQDGSGASAIFDTNDSLVADTEKTLNLTGLTDGVNYDIYVLAEDGSSNSRDPVRLDIIRAPKAVNAISVQTDTNFGIVTRTSRKIDVSSFISLPGRWGVMSNGKLVGVTTGVPGTDHKFPITNKDSGDYENQDVKVGSISTLETPGARVTVNSDGYVDGIVKNEDLIVSVESGEEGKLRSPTGASAGTYEIVARCQFVDNDTETMTFIILAPRTLVVS